MACVEIPKDSMPTVTSWMHLCCAQQGFPSVLGDVTECGDVGGDAVDAGQMLEWGFRAGKLSIPSSRSRGLKSDNTNQRAVSAPKVSEMELYGVDHVFLGTFGHLAGDRFHRVRLSEINPSHSDVFCR